METARFIGEPIEPLFSGDRGFEKRPRCPSGFIWRGETHAVVECVREWRDFVRRG